MPITINGNGTIGGVSVGGLPDGIVDTDMIAAGAVTQAKRGAASGTDSGLLQIVQTIKTDNFETSSTSFVDVTGLSASITPSSTSNKVLVRAVVCAGTGAANADNKIRILRGSTTITTNDTFVRNDHISEAESYVIEILDSPSTTSATTYKLQAKAESNEVFVNRRNNDDTMGESSITLMEVAS